MSSDRQLLSAKADSPVDLRSPAQVESEALSAQQFKGPASARPVAAEAHAPAHHKPRTNEPDHAVPAKKVEGETPYVAKTFGAPILPSTAFKPREAAVADSFLQGFTGKDKETEGAKQPASLREQILDKFVHSKGCEAIGLIDQIKSGTEKERVIGDVIDQYKQTRGVPEIVYRHGHPLLADNNQNKAVRELPGMDLSVMQLVDAGLKNRKGQEVKAIRILYEESAHSNDVRCQDY